MDVGEVGGETPRAGMRVRADALRFLLVGPVGVVLGGLQYELVWRVVPELAGRAGVAWTLSSALGVAWIHAIHCAFTFRAPRGAWRATIGGAYRVYSATILLGAALMFVLVDLLRFQHNLAWAPSTALTSAVNFVFLRGLMPRSNAPQMEELP